MAVATHQRHLRDLDPMTGSARSRQAVSVLVVSTLAFTVCFMVWMMFGVIGIPIRKTLGLNATEFGLLTATPVLTGSLIRVPLGIWTDKYGGRIVMALLMAATVPAIWLMSYATAYWHFLVIGLFVGLAGGSFSVGTPYVARWFPKHRQGFAMGVYGAGNSGAAVNKFIAPALVVAFGWAMVPQVYAAVMLVAVLLFWAFSASDPAHCVPSNTRFSDQLRALKDPKVIKYCQYYSIVFGGYVALSLWMVQYYIGCANVQPELADVVLHHPQAQCDIAAEHDRVVLAVLDDLRVSQRAQLV